MGSKAQNRATVKYVKNNYDRLDVKARKETKLKERVEKHIVDFDYRDTNTGRISRNEFILKAIETQMKIDRGELKVIE